MMDGPGGHALTQETIDEAVACRLATAACTRNSRRRRTGSSSRGMRPRSRTRERQEVPFHEASAEQLSTDPECWVLHPGEKWHGFDGIPDGWCMLDPIKFGIVCPGMQDDGKLAEHGIPPTSSPRISGRHGIVPSRTTDHMVLFLFSVGITKGKWGTLLNTLLDFKADYDRNAPLERSAARHRGRGRRALRRHGTQGPRRRDVAVPAHQPDGPLAGAGLRHAAQARDGAAPRVPEADGWRCREGAARQARNRVVGVGVIPYPPGIPIVMPGENIGAADGPWIKYLHTLEEWGHKFPGFAKEVEGTEEKDGTFYVYCLK
jgi:arginine decarboxylase